MKSIIFIVLISLSLNRTHAEEVALKTYTDNLMVKNILDKFDNGPAISEIKIQRDPITKFLVSLDHAVLINKALVVSKGSHFVNLPFTGRAGHIYNSGITPESIEDEQDREQYRKLVKINKDNSATVNRIYDIKKILVELMSNELSNLDENHREIAAKLIDSVSK